MNLKVRCFSVVRAAFDADEVDVTVPDGATAADLIAAIRARAGGKLDGFPMRVARNQVFARPDECLEAGDELAVIPPVQGG